MIDEQAKVGRPEFKPTKARRDKVMLHVACGMSHEGIAAVLGCSRNTLEKWFDFELKNGKDIKRAENQARIEEAAAGGNVAAMRLLALHLEGGAGDTAAALGKKEAARIAARNPEPGTPLGDLMRKRQVEVLQDGHRADVEVRRQLQTIHGPQELGMP